MYSKNRKPVGKFTLIELLVVIVIIAVLAGMLLPALSGARKITKRIQCISNEKQMFTAITGYLNDYNCIVKNSKVVGGPMASIDQPYPWHQYLVYLGYVNRTLKQADHVPLNPIFQEPAYTGKSSWCQYGMPHANRLKDGDYDISITYASRKLRFPSKKFLVSETTGDSYGTIFDTGTKLNLAATAGGTKKRGLSDYHRGFSNMLFADGHADAVNYRYGWSGYAHYNVFPAYTNKTNRYPEIK